MERNEDVWYVYGLTAHDATLPAGLGGVGGDSVPVTLQPAGELQAVVSPSDELGPEPSSSNVLAHQRVLAAVMQSGTVIPFAFGTVLPPGVLTQLVTKARDECQTLLRHFAGRMEVGLKLIWQKQTFLTEVETPEIAALRRQLAQAGPGRRPTLEARLGELLEQAADRRREQYERLIFQPLASRAAAAHLGEVTTPRVILNAAFLIDRSREEEFDALVERICRPYLDRFDVSYTGPWPPYNFVTLRFGMGEGG